ncbi:MAG: glycosyltransferase family 4 protein [Nitrospira sp.]|nr:glycosyltransferase family 4 protein [Nitrospira sp.]
MKHTAPDNIPLVVLQQVCIPHYRQRLLEKLGTDPRFRVLVLADPAADVPFLPLSGAPNQCQFEPATQHVVRLPFGRSLSWQPAAVRAVIRERPDVVIAQGSPYELTAWVLAIVGRICGIPVLLWTHGLQGDESGIKWIVRAWLFRLCRGLLLYGDHAKYLLMRKGFAAGRLHVIYNSLDDGEQAAVSEQIAPEDCEAFRRSLGIGAQERVICFTGRLQPVKRLPWLLRALHLVVQQGRNVHLVLVGDGSERPMLESLVEELRLTKLVHFLGASYDESRLGLVLSTSDLAVVPSGAGLSVMHALGYGTPVLIHDKVEEHFPEWEAVKEGETGWFYRYDDLSDCAEKIIDALFPIPRKPTMVEACRSVINSRYNTTTHAQLFISAIAKHCTLATPVARDRRQVDELIPYRSFEHSVKERR